MPQFLAVPSDVFEAPDDDMPTASSQAILALVDSPNPPLRLLLGSFATTFAPQLYSQRLQTWKEWEVVSMQAE